MRRAREKVRAARHAGLEQVAGNDISDLVDFDALPGRSPRAWAEALYTGRRIRDGMFPPGLFGELAWDILLELFLAKRDGQELPIEAVCVFAPAFRSTIERYVALLQKQGLVEMGSDPGDISRGRIKLSRSGHKLMSDFFASTDG
jgi:hypothetical protein